MNANDTQVGGDHYRTEYQHWDLATDLNLGYFEGQITKYVTRWRSKNGVQDLEKAKHFTQKLIEGLLAKKLRPNPPPSNVSLPLMLYHFNRANRLWMQEEDIVRIVCGWRSLHDLQEVTRRIDAMISYSKNRDVNAVRHERDPDSAAVKAKPFPGAAPAAPTPAPLPPALVDPNDYDSPDYAKRWPDMEYAVSMFYIAQCDRHNFAALDWLRLTDQQRAKWRRAYAGRNIAGATDPNGKPCDDEGSPRREQLKPTQEQ